MFQIDSLDRLLHELSRLPGVGPRSAQRLTQHLLKNNGLSVDLREALKDVEEKIQLCTDCFNYTDSEDAICRLCKNTARSRESLCVVEQPEDIMNVEASGAYGGVYHVLHGAISPLEGITPERLKIRELLKRVEELGETLKEVILAVDSDLEGDTTVLYLNQEIAGRGLKVTRLAQGMPLGSDIDYIDDRTLNRALSNRVEV